MKTRFREIKFPSTFKYSSDSEYIPLEFYEETFPISKKIDLLLGYFSSNAIKVLSKSFAEFVFNGGEIRIITNHVLSLKDKVNLIEKVSLNDEDKVIDIFEDIEKLEYELGDHGQHFFDCLKYLLKNGRLKILPVKFNGIDLAHCKKMILFDGYDYISTDGSINFTLPGLTKNAESFEVNAPWKGEIFEKRTADEKINFNKIFQKQHPNYKYIDSKEIETIIDKIGNNKEQQDLLADSIKIDEGSFGEKVKSILNKKKIRFKEKVNRINRNPSFPFSSGPRKYQEEAYNSWVANNYSGVFSMATGTGKTITALNCLLNEYKKSNSYVAIIIVPSIALLNQWEEEARQFNFNNILKVGGGNNWEQRIARYESNYTWGIKENIVIISTYGSFITSKFQKYFKNIESDFLLIADEAHNMGANNIKKVIPSINVSKKIGLSATPKRVYDTEGTLAIEEFFNDTAPYTYNFGMEEALKAGFLTEYKYHPIIVELNENELEEYISISKKLLKYFDFKKGVFKKDKIVEILLLKRKNIIHKANNKIKKFRIILKELEQIAKLKYVFTYIPEGYATRNETQNQERLLNKFLEAGAETIKNLKMNSYTSEDDNLDEILKGFSNGKIDLLFAMKMLDEGVDIPRAEVGIFCSSTGNPRQFIQRRGRLLRKHKDKAYSTIYDMVVIPHLNSNPDAYFNMERNLVKNELRRVAYFASLSMNYYDSRDNLTNVCNKYNLNLDQIIEEL